MPRIYDIMSQNKFFFLTDYLLDFTTMVKILQIFYLQNHFLNIIIDWFPQWFVEDS